MTFLTPSLTNSDYCIIFDYVAWDPLHHDPDNIVSFRAKLKYIQRLILYDQH